MANSDAAFGFRPINRDGSPYNGATIRGVFAVGDTTAAFIGDPVFLAGEADAVTGDVSVSQCATAEDVFGVVTSFEVNPDDLGAQYRKAETKRFCQIATADNTYFEVQENGADDALLVTDVGFNVDYVVAAGSTVYGISGFELDAATENTTSTLDCQLVGFVNRADNLIVGTGNANKKCIIKFNNSQSRPTRTGIS